MAERNSRIKVVEVENRDWTSYNLDLTTFIGAKSQTASLSNFKQKSSWDWFSPFYNIEVMHCLFAANTWERNA